MHLQTLIGEGVWRDPPATISLLALAWASLEAAPAISRSGEALCADRPALSGTTASRLTYYSREDLLDYGGGDSR